MSKLNANSKTGFGGNTRICWIRSPDLGTECECDESVSVLTEFRFAISHVHVLITCAFVCVRLCVYAVCVCVYRDSVFF